MRDSSVLQLSTSADMSGDCLSLAGVDGNFSSQSALLRRPSGVTGDTYTTRTTGSSGSSSGGSVGEDGGGWWATAWATGRGWQGSQIHQDSIYDTPRGTPCSPAQMRMMSRSSSSRKIDGHGHTQGLDRSNKNISYDLGNRCPTGSNVEQQNARTPTNVEASQQQPSFVGTFSSGNVTNNPMENYDVPRPIAESYYDTPRKLFGGPAPVVGIHGSSCASVLGWAGALVCGRNVVTDNQSNEGVKINGEGRMPLVNASTGVLLQQPLQVQHQHFQGDLYAVVNKSKPGSIDSCSNALGKSGKQRAKTPPPEDTVTKIPAKSEHNYVNITPQSISSEAKTPDSVSICSNCHGFVPSPADNSFDSKNDNQNSGFHSQSNDSNEGQKTLSCSVTANEFSTLKSDTNAKADDKDIHYIVMKPTSETIRINQSHYICMNSPSFHSVPKPNMNYHSASLPRQFSGAAFRHNSPPPNLNQIPSSISYTSSPLTSSSSSRTLCSSTSGYHLCSVAAESKNDKAKIGKSCVIPRNGRSLSLARNDNIYVYGRPRSNSADSRMGDFDIWANDHFSPLNTPPISPNRRRRKSRKSNRSRRRHCKDSYLPGENDSGCDLQEAVLRRSSSAPGKTVNRDSASSNDSGVGELLKMFSPEINECVRRNDANINDCLKPLDLMLGSPCLHGSLPRPKNLPQNIILCYNQIRHPSDQGR